MADLTSYFNNIYIVIASTAGIIALASLIIAGVLFLTSAGDAEKLSKARKQILATFVGIILLLSSYLILRSINPELVSFEILTLEPITLQDNNF